MAPHGGGRDYPSHTDPRSHIDSEAAWTKADIAIILVLIVAPIIGIIFGL